MFGGSSFNSFNGGVGGGEGEGGAGGGGGTGNTALDRIYRHRHVLSRVFKYMDADHDGSLSESEVQKGDVCGEGISDFHLLPIPRGGSHVGTAHIVLLPTTIVPSLGFTVLNKNLAPDSQLPGARHVFTMMDTNHNGQVCLLANLLQLHPWAAASLSSNQLQ